MNRKHTFFLLEIAALFLFTLGIDHFFFDGDRFWDLQLHPFLFIVLIISVQYGTNKGLLTAALASIALLAGNLPEQTILQDKFDYLFYLSYRPILWVGLAVLFGGFHDRYSRNLKSLTENLSVSNNQAEEFSKAYKLLDKERHRLETNLSSQSSSVLSLHQAALKMKALEPSEVSHNILEVTETVMKSEKSSWFFLHDSALKLAHKKGWQDNEIHSNSFSNSSHLYREVVERRRVIHIANPEDEPLLQNEGLLAGPVIDKEQDKVYGMIKIEELGFLGLNLSNIETFKALCEWFGTLLENATRIHSAQFKVVQNSQNGLFTQNYFGYIKDFLSHLGERVAFENHTISLHISDKYFYDSQILLNSKLKISEIIQKTVRNTDLVFEGAKRDFEYVILLPSTSQYQAQLVSEKLFNELCNEFGTQPAKDHFSIAIRSLEDNKSLSLKSESEIFTV